MVSSGITRGKESRCLQNQIQSQSFVILSEKQGKYHRSIKNVVNLQHYYLPGELEQEIARFVEYYNNHRYHESLDNLTPADVYYGRAEERLSLRESIKNLTIKSRRKYNQGKGGLKKQLLLAKITP